MRTLQSQTKWMNQAQWILGTSILVLGAGAYLFGYQPQVNRINELNKEITTARAELAANRIRVQALPTVEHEVKTLRAKLQTFDKILPRRTELSSFLESMAHFRQQYALQHWDYQPRVEKRSNLFTELPIEMSFDGDFNNVYAFLRQMEDMPRLTRVRSISIRTKNARLGLVEVQMAMNIYCSEG